MKRTPLVGMCLAAALATGTTLASVAAAAPPEFSPPFPNAFHSASKAMTLETVGKLKITCTADTSSGEVTGPKTTLVTITFTGCTSAEVKCQNAHAGEIVTERLSGTLGYLSKKHTAVGLDLTSAGGGPMVAFFCGEDLRIEVLGSLIGKVTPINKVIEPSADVRLKFAQKEGHQAIKRLLGGTRDVPLTSVLGGPLQESGISSTELLSFAAPIEIIADDTPPVFAGLKSATTCIPGPIGGEITGSYHLSWEGATDDVTPSSGIVYEIYPATTPGGEDFSKATYTTAPGVTSFDTPQLPSDKFFYFVVRARDQAGNEDSNTIEREGQNLCV